MVQCTYICTYGTVHIRTCTYIRCTHGTVYIWYSAHTVYIRCTYVIVYIRTYTYGEFAYVRVHTVLRTGNLPYFVHTQA